MKINFNEINEKIRNAETSFVNLISAIAPWLAPISPAYMTYVHARDTLEFPLWVALPVAVVVEILGFSAVSTFMMFWFFNRRNKAVGKKAPIPLVVFAFFFYLALIVTSNIVLDSSGGAEWAKITVRALFTFQTIPAALIVISRAGHKSLLDEIEKAKLSQKVSEPDEKVSGNFPNDWRKVLPFLTPDDLKAMAKMRTSEIQSKYHLKQAKTAQNWRVYAQNEVKKMEQAEAKL